MSTATQLAVDWTEQGLVPDGVIRHGIRRLLRSRLAELRVDDAQAAAIAIEEFVAHMDQAPIAPVPDKANAQHYEVPQDFFGLTLGTHRKYSSCYWPDGITHLDAAEVATLKLTCERADILDGANILELGCGWGSLTLWMAAHYPRSRVVAVSNSHSQREYILDQAALRGLNNVSVVTSDMNRFETTEQFDRIVSVEMFEHMRDWRLLLSKVARWLTPDGRFFMHVFCHRAVSYCFVDNGPSDWMSRYFFSGGIMPSDELPIRFQDDLCLRRRWRWDGTHYQKTANAWLANLDARRDEVWSVLERTYGAKQAQLWWMRWRLFFMACAELFGYEHGQQWWVSHYLFDKPARMKGGAP